MRAWECEDGAPVDLPELLAAALAVDEAVPLFDANNPSLSAPGDMLARIAALLGTEPPPAKAGFARSIVESIAAAFADAVQTASDLSGRVIESIQFVDGGSLNRLLCQATADRTGLPVPAGPVEATALGNVLVQARALDAAPATLEDLRALVAATHPMTKFSPRADHRSCSIMVPTSRGLARVRSTDGAACPAYHRGWGRPLWGPQPNTRPRVGPEELGHHRAEGWDDRFRAAASSRGTAVANAK